jgi:heavy metal translocating P-type ATPase
LKKLLQFVRHYWQFCFAVVASLVALGLQIAGLNTAVHWILGISASLLVLPLLWGMFEDLRDGTYGIDILAATAIIVSVVMHQYWAGMVIVLMLTGGESLEDYAEHRASRELDALLTRAPQKARILRGKQEVEVKASEVREGDKIVLRPGEVVPVDATILEGTSSFDESSLTGESLPEVKKKGQSIMSGSINLEGAITAEALHSAADSQYEQIIKLVRAANNSKAPFVRLADRYAIPFTVISFGIAGIAWALSGESLRFLQVLVVATPCPLILAAPIAIISGMSRAARQGIIIKNGSALEQLAQAETFAFDKTGTITAGQPQVDKIHTFNGHKQAEVLALAAALEQNSNHVLANAIVKKAQAAGGKVPKVKNVQEVAGNGLAARLSGKTVLVGRLSLLQENDIALPGKFDLAAVQQTAAFVAVDKTLAGIITFVDEVRPEAKKTLSRLRELGVKEIMMVTGDSQAIAKAVAKKVGIKTFYAEALPGDKIQAIEKAKQRPLAFVGDGVNDAPVLTASDVGIALGARGSTAASESADIVIMMDNLQHVAESRLIAKRTFFIAKQSILVGIGLSVALMLIFATGKFKPIYGAAIQELVDVVVIFNALRAHVASKRLQ